MNFESFSKLVNSEFYSDFETFSKLVDGNENVSTNKILGSLEILAIKKEIKREIRQQLQFRLDGGMAR